MKRLLHAILIGCAGIPACSPLGSIQPDTVNAIASAGGGCVAVKSLVMGEGVLIIANADKGSLKNGTVSVTATHPPPAEAMAFTVSGWILPRGLHPGIPAQPIKMAWIRRFMWFSFRGRI